MQHLSENCCILGIRHAVSSKVQGTVKVRKIKKVRNLNSTPILLCNPGAHSTSLAQLAEQLEAAASNAACLAAERDALATQLRAAEARCTGSSTHGSSRREGKDPRGDRNSNQLSADRTAAICGGVYEHMLQRGMTSADGYPE